MKVVLTEKFDEGLMVMRRLMGWEMMDMTYTSMYKTVNGAHRFDGKPLVESPHFEDLPEHVRRHGIFSIFQVGSVCSAKLRLHKKHTSYLLRRTAARQQFVVD